MEKQITVVDFKYDGEFSKVEIKDSDTLVFKILDPVPREKFHILFNTLGDKIKEKFPNNRILILPQNIDFSVMEEGE